jgi:mannosyltransferase OCH1-like enzyme
MISVSNQLKLLLPDIIESKISKYIHQTYISIETLPNIWKNTPDSWKKQHPDWTYMFWSDVDCLKLVKEKFPWFLQTYKGFEYNIQRADAIRPMILYEYGGIYADCDIQSIKPFDDLFYEYHDIYLIRTPNNNVVTNCLMASGKPGIEFWLHVLNEMKYRYNNPSMLWIGKHITVMYTTGPMMLNYIYNKHHKTTDILFLPRELLLPSECGTCSSKPCFTISSYTSLLEGSSWVGYDTICFNFIMCSYPRLLVLIVIAFLLYTFYNQTKLLS